MPGLFSFPFHWTMQDKFTPREPFVGCTAQAICSLLGERQLTVHLSPPAAGDNSTDLEPGSRGASGGSGIRIPHHNGSAEKQKTDLLGPLQFFTKEGAQRMTLGDGTRDECSAIIKNTAGASRPSSFVFFAAGNLSSQGEFSIII